MISPMDEVEIKNVGGRGVASDATLLLLIDAVKGTDAADSIEQRLRDLHNKSLKESTKDQGKLSKATTATIGAVGTFADKLLITGDRLGDFSSMLLGSGKITRFVNFVDKTVDQFRDLSSAGASFNNSLADMVRTSVDASMGLDEFVGMVRSNSEELARFGGSTTRGAKLIGEFSRDVRMGIGQRFFEMGMTMENVNEGLISYMTLETMRGRRNIRSDAATQAGAAEYIMQLDKLAKLTGKQRDALMESQAALQTDGQVRNQLARVEEQLGAAKAEELRAIYTLQETSLPGFHKSLLDLSDGVAQSDLGRALQNAVPGITQFMQRVGEGSVSQAEYVDYMANNVQPNLQRFARQMPDATLQVLRGMGGVQGAMAQMVDDTHEFSTMINMNSAEAEAEQRRVDRVTGTLGKFEQALADLRSFIFSTFIDSAFATELGQIGTDMMEAFGSGGTGVFSSMRNAITDTMRYLFGETGIFTGGLRWVANYLKSDGFQGVLEGVGTAFGVIVDWGKNFIDNIGEDGLWKALLEEVQDFGSMIAGAFTRLFQNQELLDSISDAFVNVSNYIMDEISDLWGDSRAQEMLQSMVLFIEDQMLNLIDTLNEGFLGYFIRNRPQDERREAQQERAFENNSLGPDAMAAMAAALRAESANLEARIAAPGMFTSQPTMDAYIARNNEIGDLLAAAPGFSKGTDGFQEFGSGTLAVLHNSEAVVPRDSEAGEMLAKFYNNHKPTSSHDNISSRTPEMSYNTEEVQPTLSDARNSPLSKAGEMLAKFYDNLDTRASQTSQLLEPYTNAGKMLERFYDNLDTRASHTAESSSSLTSAGEMLSKLYGNQISQADRAAESSLSLTSAGEMLSKLYGNQISQAAESSSSLTSAGEMLSKLYDNQISQAAESSSSLTSASDMLSKLYGNQSNRLLESVENVTNGFQSFSRGTPGMLHNTEAVAARDTDTKKMLEQFLDSQKRTSELDNSDDQKRTSLSALSDNQTGVIDKLNEVNSNIIRLLTATQQGVNVQERTRKSVRGLGSDMFKGAGL
jgi:hypothetical protein